MTKNIAYFFHTEHLSLPSFWLEELGYHVTKNPKSGAFDILYSSSGACANLWEANSSITAKTKIEWCWDLPNWRSWLLRPEEISKETFRDEKNAKHVKRLASADLILTGTNWVANDLISKGLSQNKIKVVTPWLNVGCQARIRELNMPVFQKATRRPLVVQLSRIGAINKRFDDTVKIAQLNPHLDFILAGYDPIRFFNRLNLDSVYPIPQIFGASRKFIRLANRLGCQNVKLMPNINQNVKWQLINKADIVISPQSEDGWGMSLLEGLFKGTPIVTTDIQNYQDLYSDLVHKGKAGDIESMSFALNSTLQDQEFCQTQISGLANYIDDISDKSFAERLDKIFKNIN